MDIHSNLEYLCRVCAANTKGKNSVAECVYIFKTDGLKDKLDKYLYLKISENDSLPKVLCKSCFRQLEATAALSKIAKHTQEVFRDFLLSNLPKGPSESTNNSECTSSNFTTEKSKKNEITASIILQKPTLQPITSGSRKDEVIVNVSVADPLTRDNQQKMISNSQRRQSVLLDTRFTPKSIAQKPPPTIVAAAAQKVIASKSNQITETGNATNTPKTTTATITPSLNFYPVKPQQPTQITTFSSGGYVIGRINNNSLEEAKKSTAPVAPTADNILQQKRKNLVKALNNIKANNSGQISLLKSSQQKQILVAQTVAKTPLAEVVNQATEDELPDKIIIAAPKSKVAHDKSKKEPLNLSNKLAIVPVVPPVTQVAIANTTAALVQQQENPVLVNNTPSKSNFPEDILLGRVIRDMDLLKLILKALKWPVNKQNMELQLQRLKNSKFTDIMSDYNLLQDTDLTQLLGPYLAPVLLAAQALQQQQQQLLKNTTLNRNMTAAFIAPAKDAVLEAAYRLPPETSVQLVPATPEEQESNSSPPLGPLTSSALTNPIVKRTRQKEAKTMSVPQKRQRRAAAQRARDSIVISDEEDGSTEEETNKKSRHHSAKTAANIQINLNNDLMSQFNLLAGSGGVEANEALLALLQRQKAAIMKDNKIQRRRRNSVSNIITLPANEFDALIDLDDDIVLMEPVSTTSSSSENVSATFKSEQIVQKADASNIFAMPQVPLITRPIIKRRKTVIHSSRGRLDISADKVQTPAPTSSSPAKQKLLEETINLVATGNITASTENKSNTPQIIAKSPTNEKSLPSTTATIKVTPQQKKLQNKATLGQQLLEAIGLQQIPTKIADNQQSEATTTSTTKSNAITALPNSKQSIQQIRSALKKSLKQAQEQQQQRIRDLSVNNTIIQDADSTTKTAVKEIVVVEGKGNKTDTDSSMVDVEDQIDKVTLMVRNNDDKNSSEQQTADMTTTENKDTKKSPTSKVQERRRTMLSLGAQGAGARNVTALEVKENIQENVLEEEEKVQNIKTAEENEKSEKQDSEHANISSSSIAVLSTSSNDTNATPKDEVATPKRRGRKRLIDDKTSPTITERSRIFDKSKEEEIESASDMKTEEETASNKASGRPTRQSKTLSKYYKGPDKATQCRRSLPSRTTRNR